MVETQQQIQSNGFCEECGALLIDTCHETTCPNCGLVHNDLILKEESVFFKDKIAFRNIMTSVIPNKTCIGTKWERTRIMNHRIVKLQKITGESTESRKFFINNLIIQLQQKLQLDKQIVKNTRFFANKILKAEIFEKSECVSQYIVAVSLEYSIKIHPYPVFVDCKKILKTIKELGHCARRLKYLDYTFRFKKYFNKKQIVNTPENFFEKILNEIFEHPEHQNLNKQDIFRKGIKILSLIKNPPKARNRIAYICCAIVYLVSDSQISTPFLLDVFGYHPSTILKYYNLLIFALMKQFKLFPFAADLIKKRLEWDGF